MKKGEAEGEADRATIDRILAQNRGRAMPKSFVLPILGRWDAMEYIPAERLTQERIDRAILEFAAKVRAERKAAMTSEENNAVIGAIEAAVAAEREACAKVAAGWLSQLYAKAAAEGFRVDLRMGSAENTFAAVAAAIRARGERRLLTREELVKKMQANMESLNHGPEAGNAEAEAPAQKGRGQ